MKHAQSDRSFACDPYEDIFPGQRKFLVTASAEHRPTARNTFRIIRPEEHLRNVAEDSYDDLLRYGQPFHLACNESLLVSEDGYAMAPDLYLASTLKNERTATRVTNKQAVYLTAKADANSIWIVCKPSRGRLSSLEKFASEGSPVSANESFVLNHRASNTNLTTNMTTKSLTDFGEDYEVCTARELSIGKLSLMEAEFKGTATPNTLSKANLPQTDLYFELSTTEEGAVDNRILPQPPSYDDVVEDLSHAVKSFGVTGILEVRKALLDLDRGSRGGASTGRVTVEAVKNYLASKGIVTQDGYYDPVFRSLEARKDGYLDFRDLMDVIRGPLPQGRLDFLAKVFNDLDKQGTGEIYLEDLRGAFNPTHYPVVQSGLLSERNMKNDYFANVIGHVVKKKVKVVTFDHFVDYFADISGAVRDDQYFEDLINNTWA